MSTGTATPAPAKKKGPSKKAIAAGAVVVIAALAAIGGGNKTPAPSNTSGGQPVATPNTGAGNTTATLNTPYSIEGVTITIKKVEKSTGSQFLKPAVGNVYVGYLVNIAASQDGRFVNIADWTALSDGTKQGQWTIASGMESWTPTLSIAEIRNGASVEGWIAFEVPTPSTFVRLVYHPGFFSTEAKLTFDATVS